MRLFFAASIGFQVPIKDFADGTVIWHGLVFTISLLGKFVVGFMSPNFTQEPRFTGNHLRDCLITGLSLAAEGEFSFVIAVFSVESGLIDPELYASVVLAILLSAIVPPFLLRYIISYYNKKNEKAVQALAKVEMDRQHDLEAGHAFDHEAALVADIKNQTAVFLCIQTQSESRWGLLHSMMATMAELGLEVIDHRSWHPRGVNTTLVNEVYVKDSIEVQAGDTQALLEKRIDEIREKIQETIGGESAKVQVQRWYPGVVEEIIEEVNEKQRVDRKKKISVEESLLHEAQKELDRKQKMQTSATTDKTVDDILNEMGKSPQFHSAGDNIGVEGGIPGDHGTQRRARRRRQKMRSTPVVGGGLFGETDTAAEQEFSRYKPSASRPFAPAEFKFSPPGGVPAEIIVNGEMYNVRISDAALRNLQSGFSGEMLDSRGISVHAHGIERDDNTTFVNRLTGYVRSAQPLSSVAETDENESNDGMSSVPESSVHNEGLSNVAEVSSPPPSERAFDGLSSPRDESSRPSSEGANDGFSSSPDRSSPPPRDGPYDDFNRATDLSSAPPHEGP